MATIESVKRTGDPRAECFTRPRTLTPALLAVVALSLLPGSATAQDSHWWTNQYGNRARLLGGAVIGSSSDLSAIYYNPGALALVERPEALLTGYVFELDNLALKDIFRPGSEISSTRFAAVAGLVAGEIRLGFLGESRLAYSFITRHIFEYRLGSSVELTGDEIDVPELSTVSGSLRVDSRLSEYWGGLTWSVPLSDRVGLGVTLFGASRNQRARSDTDLAVVAEDLSAGVAVRTRDYSYGHWRLLAKIGLRANLSETWTAGLTLTTPSLRLFGSGEVGVNLSTVAGPVQEVAVSFEDGIASKYRNPVSVGAGAAYSGDDWGFHAAIEWFDGLDIVILDAEPFDGQTSGEVFDPNVDHRMKPVLNAGIGVAKTFSEKLSGYGSFHTDFSGADREDPSVTTTALWDLYSLGAGAIFAVGRSEFTAGLNYAFGSEQPLSPADPTGDDPVARLLGQGRATYSRWTFIIGFSLEFAPDVGG